MESVIRKISEIESAWNKSSGRSWSVWESCGKKCGQICNVLWCALRFTEDMNV